MAFRYYNPPDMETERKIHQRILEVIEVTPKNEIKFNHQSYETSICGKCQSPRTDVRVAGYALTYWGSLAALARVKDPFSNEERDIFTACSHGCDDKEIK